MTLKDLKARIKPGMMLRKVMGPPRQGRYDVLRVVVSADTVGFATEGEGVLPSKGPSYSKWPLARDFKDTGFGFIVRNSRHGDIEWEWVHPHLDNGTAKDGVVDFMLNTLELCDDRDEQVLALGDRIGNHALAASIIDGWWSLSVELRIAMGRPEVCARSIRQWLDCYSDWVAITKDIDQTPPPDVAELDLQCFAAPEPDVEAPPEPPKLSPLTVVKDGESLIHVRRLDDGPGKLTINAVMINCDHNKDRKAVTLSAYPADASGSSVGIIITAGEYANVEAMPRLNRNRLADVQSLTRNQLVTRTGQAWDLVGKVCERNGLTPV